MSNLKIEYNKEYWYLCPYCLEYKVKICNEYSRSLACCYSIGCNYAIKNYQHFMHTTKIYYIDQYILGIITKRLINKVIKLANIVIE